MVATIFKTRKKFPGLQSPLNSPTAKGLKVTSLKQPPKTH